VLPQALLFDEQYGSHQFYQWDRVDEWFHDSDVLVPRLPDPPLPLL
jgi:hypothetical protein